MTAAIYQLEQKQEAKFECSACGADRGCNCNAPAIEKLAGIIEQRRKAKRAFDERKRQQKQQSGNITDQGSGAAPTGPVGVGQEVADPHLKSSTNNIVRQVMRFAADFTSTIEEWIGNNPDPSDEASAALVRALDATADVLRELSARINER